MNNKKRKNLIPCKYRDITYCDIIYYGYGDSRNRKRYRSQSNLREQRKSAKWQNGFYSFSRIKDGTIHSYLVYNEFDYFGQLLQKDVKTYNPLHALLIRVSKRIYTGYTDFKIRLTKKVGTGIIQKTRGYLMKRIIDLEIELEDSDWPIGLSEKIKEVELLQEKFEQFISEEKETK